MQAGRELQHRHVLWAQRRAELVERIEDARRVAPAPAPAPAPSPAPALAPTPTIAPAPAPAHVLASLARPPQPLQLPQHTPAMRPLLQSSTNAAATEAHRSWAAAQGKRAEAAKLAQARAQALGQALANLQPLLAVAPANRKISPGQLARSACRATEHYSQIQMNVPSTAADDAVTAPHSTPTPFPHFTPLTVFVAAAAAAATPEVTTGASAILGKLAQQRQSALQQLLPLLADTRLGSADRRHLLAAATNLDADPSLQTSMVEAETAVEAETTRGAAMVGGVTYSGVSNSFLQQLQAMHTALILALALSLSLNLSPSLSLSQSLRLTLSLSLTPNL